MPCSVLAVQRMKYHLKDLLDGCMSLLGPKRQRLAPWPPLLLKFQAGRRIEVILLKNDAYMRLFVR